MSILELVKNGGSGVLSIRPSIRSMLSILTKFEQQGKKKTTQKKRAEKQRNEQPWTLHFGSLNYKVSFKLLFLVWTLDHLVFSPK
jgi:hypothetical protein